MKKISDDERKKLEEKRKEALIKVETKLKNKTDQTDLEGKRLNVRSEITPRADMISYMAGCFQFKIAEDKIKGFKEKGTQAKRKALAKRLKAIETPGEGEYDMALKAILGELGG